MGFLTNLIGKLLLRLAVFAFVAVVCLNMLVESGVMEQFNSSMNALGIDVSITDVIFHPGETIGKVFESPFRQLDGIDSISNFDLSRFN